MIVCVYEREYECVCVCVCVCEYTIIWMYMCIIYSKSPMKSVDLGEGVGGEGKEENRPFV